MDVDKPGRLDLFCAIHTNMHAVVLAVESTHFAVADDRGAFRIEDVPPGKHEIVIWHEVHGERRVTADVKADAAAVVKQSVGSS